VFMNGPYLRNNGPSKFVVYRCDQLNVLFRSGQAIIFYYVQGFVSIIQVVEAMNSFCLLV
jgi:hypothetical protein